MFGVGVTLGQGGAPPGQGTGMRTIKSLENMTYSKDEKSSMFIFKEGLEARDNSCNITFCYFSLLKQKEEIG